MFKKYIMVKDIIFIKSHKNSLVMYEKIYVYDNNSTDKIAENAGVIVRYE